MLPRASFLPSMPPDRSWTWNIAFLSSCKQNPFLPLEHSLEIDSAYIGLPTALQPLSCLAFPFHFSSLSRGFLFRRAAPTVCRGTPLSPLYHPRSTGKSNYSAVHENDIGAWTGCNGSREGDRGVESIFPWRLEGGKRIFLRIEEFLFLFDSSSSVRMNNSSLKNFEHVPLRVNFVGHRRISSVCIIDEDTCSISGRAIFAVLRCKKRREWREERGKGKEQNRENLMIVTIRFILSLKCFIRHFLCYVRINLIFLSRV